jgi:hypothetical protein
MAEGTLMHRSFRWIAPALALGLMSLFSGRFAKAADAPATQPSAAPTTQPQTGSITVLVVDSNNQPVADIPVRLFPPRQHHAAQGNQAEGGGGGQGGHNRPKPIAQGTTDAKGSVTFDKIPLGDYMLRAGKRGIGRGNANVSLAAAATGGPATASVTITLEAPPAGGGGGNGGGAPGGNGGAPTGPPATGA